MQKHSITYIDPNIFRSGAVCGPTLRPAANMLPTPRQLPVKTYTQCQWGNRFRRQQVPRMFTGSAIILSTRLSPHWASDWVLRWLGTYRDGRRIRPSAVQRRGFDSSLARAPVGGGHTVGCALNARSITILGLGFRPRPAHVIFFRPVAFLGSPWKDLPQNVGFQKGVQPFHDRILLSFPHVSRAGQGAAPSLRLPGTANASDSASLIEDAQIVAPGENMACTRGNMNLP